MSKFTRHLEQMETTCTLCDGYGFLEDSEFGMIDDNEPCPLCHGQGYVVDILDTDIGFSIYDISNEYI